MKKKEMVAIVENRFKTLDKLCSKIRKGYNADDIHDFRVEVKKLRAFLRLAGIKKQDGETTIPKPLKALYAHAGVLRNIYLFKQNLFEFATHHSIKEPRSYLRLLNKEEDLRKKDIKELLSKNIFPDVKEKILKELPGKPGKHRIKKFIQHKLSDLEKLLEGFNDDTTMHSIRKILKDLLYTWLYIKNYKDLPKIISRKSDLKSIAATLGNFMDKFMELEFLQAHYLNEVKAKGEKLLLVSVQKKWSHEKLVIKKELGHNLNSLKKQLHKMKSST